MQAVETRVFGRDVVARRMSRAEYDRLVSLGFYTNERVELIHGIVVRMSPIGPPHSEVVARLNSLLVLGLHTRAAVRCQLPANADDDSEPEPDFAIVPQRSYATAHPDTAFFVIEVADSSLKYDRETKGPLYAASAIPEYWVVDVAGKAIEVYTAPVDGRYTKMDRSTTSVSPAAFPDFVVTVASLFD